MSLRLFRSRRGFFTLFVLSLSVFLFPYLLAFVILRFVLHSVFTSPILYAHRFLLVQRLR